MDQDQRNQLYRKMADSFIDTANIHCETVDNSEVGSAMLFATSRFSSFVVASHANNKTEYENGIDNAVEHFSDEFRRMLIENLEQYKTVFDDAPKYEHLMKSE